MADNSYKVNAVAGEMDKLRRLADWTMKIDKVLARRRVPYSVKGVLGKSFSESFKRGGAPNKKWQALSAYTAAVRVKRGYPSNGPILVQGGGLRSLAADIFLERWSESGANGQALSDYANSGATLFSASITPYNFKATISGPKVNNMETHTQIAPNDDRRALLSAKNTGYVPARPFWYLNDAMVTDMQKAMSNYYMKAWVAEAKRTVYLTGTAFPMVGDG